MHGPPVIEVRDLAKTFHMHRGAFQRLRAAFATDALPGASELRALDGVSFAVGRGGSLGIVGPNGAGKSTLLKILAGILAPSSGEVRIEGRVASIIELGAGFHPEFTGRQNFFMNGSILGFSAEELRDLYDRAVAFSGLGEFMDMPIKMYSSGMIARLAFTVAIHSEPDVLIVDEALAVGDAIFSHRCLGRIQHMLQRGTALVLVTHDVNAVRQMCDQAMLIDAGKAITQGEPETVLMRYQTLVAERLSAAGEQFQQTGLEQTVRGEDLRYGTFDAVIEGVTVGRPDGERTRRFQSRDTVRIAMAVHFRRDVEDPIFGIMLRNRFGLEVFGTNTHMRRERFGPVPAGAERTVTIDLDLSLVPGTYAVSLAVHTPEGEFHDYQVEAATLEVLPPISVIGVANLPITLDVTNGIERDAIEVLTPAPAKESRQ